MKHSHVEVVLTGGVELASHTSDGPLLEREYVIVPDGEVKSLSGDFVLDERSAGQAISAFNSLDRDVAVDYEHRSIAEDADTAPAAGWIKALRYEAGKGLLGLIRWTARAADMIRAGEYKYLSPVLLLEKEGRKVIELFNAALVTNPAIQGMPPLTAFSRRIFVMADQPQEPQEPQETAQSVDTLIVSIRELLSLPEDAAPEDILQAAIDALKGAQASEEAVANSAKALGLAGDAGGVEVIAAITRLRDTTVAKDKWVQANSRLDELEKHNAALTAKMVHSEADALIAHYVGKGKLTQGQANIHRDRLTADPNNFEAVKEGFVEYMEVSPVVIQQGATEPPGGAGGTDRETIINRAAAEFDSQPGHANSTSKRAFVNLGLREVGKGRLTDEEAKTHLIVSA